MPKAGIQFSAKDEWFTPKEVIDKFGPFDYDPATNGTLARMSCIPNYDTIFTNGLNTDWTKYRKIWCNPPFTKKFDFLKKAVESKRHVFFLLPIETLTTKKFHEIVKVPYDMHVPNGRVKFTDVTGGGGSSPAFGSVILEFGDGVGGDIKHWELYG